MVSDESQFTSDISITSTVAALNNIKELEIDFDSSKKDTLPLPSPDENLIPLSSAMSTSAYAVRPLEMTVASAVTSGEKARFRQLTTHLDRWVNANGNNLYPTREEKEKLAEETTCSYIQVNRWFANRRRKQTKRTKIMNSPVCVTPVPQASMPDDCMPSDSGCSTAPDAVNFINPDVFGSPADSSSDEKAEMVAQHLQNPEASPLTPPVDEALHQYHQNHVVPDMSQLTADPAIQKLLASYPHLLNPLLNQSILTLLQPYALHHFIQSQMHVNQLYNQQFVQMAAPQQHPAPQQLWTNTSLPPMGMDGGSISASPAHVSDSEVSDFSELSPHPVEMTPMSRRPHSPPFKDGHKLADPTMMALMDMSNLSEREQVAVTMLMEMHTVEIP